MNRFVYLDNNATTKISERVREKMLPYLDLQFGNPSSIYGHGAKIRKAVEDSRFLCAKLLGCSSSNLIFTSGGSESNCTAFNSAVNQFPTRKKIVTTKVEHSSILEYCKLLERRGFEVVYLDVDENCNIDLKQLEKAVDGNTALLSIQFANNEVGTILLTDKVLKAVEKLKKKCGFLFHVDAVQALGKCEFDISKINVDFVSFSGHKIHCPKGVGMLFVKDTKNFVPMIAGHQEFGLRGGTENVLGIVALGCACEYINFDLKKIEKNLKENNDYLEDKLKKIDGLEINCQKAKRIPNTTSVTFDEVAGNKLMLKLDKRGICVSTGSACNSESSEPSYVLVSMGLKNPQNTIRISIDENTTKSQIDYFIDNLKDCL